MKNIADGSIVFNTKINTDGFKQGTKAVSSKMIGLGNKVAQTEQEIKSLTAELEKMANTPIKSDASKKLESDIAKAKNQLRSFYEDADKIGDAKQAELTSMGFDTQYLDDILAQDESWNKVQSKIAQTEDKLRGYEHQLEQIRAAESKTTGKDTAEYAKKKGKTTVLNWKFECI